METGSNKSLYTLIAVVVFGIFLSLSYFLYQDQLKSVLASVLDGTSQMTSLKLDNNGIVPTDKSNFTYTVVAGVIKINDYKGNTSGITDVIIPAYINGMPVEIIGTRAFFNKGLTSIKFPETLKIIEDGTGVEGTFEYNHLTEVVFPDSVTYIGFDSFSSNPITNVKLSKNITKIISYSFCTGNLTTIDIPDGVTRIESYAFRYNPNLKTVYLPKSVTFIDPTAFAQDVNFIYK